MPWPGLAAMNAGQKSCQTHLHTPLNHNSLMLQVYGCQHLEQILTLVSRGLFQCKDSTVLQFYLLDSSGSMLATLV